jgi:hypothetical protein
VSPFSSSFTLQVSSYPLACKPQLKGHFFLSYIGNDTINISTVAKIVVNVSLRELVFEEGSGATILWPGKCMGPVTSLPHARACSGVV